jgi:hypothetical protein
MKTNRLGEKNYKWREVNNMKKILCLFCLLLGLLIAANAWADLTLGVPNSNLLGYGFPAPYATVHVTLDDATSATITFTGLANTYNSSPVQYLLGDGGMVALNVNGAFTITAGDISGSGGNNPLTLKSPNPIGSGNVSEFGVFNLVIAENDGFSYAQQIVTLVLTLSSGTWSSADDVLTPNADGYQAAAHIFPVTGTEGDWVDTYTSQTGFAADGTKVPEPSTLLLLGAGLLGVGFVRRKFKK